MAILPIRVYPDPILRASCTAVETFDDELATLVADMTETMYRAPGVGLAAPQIGLTKQLAVVDVTVGEEAGAVRVLINPRLLAAEGEEVDSEACLSIPDLSEKVRRPARIEIAAQGLDGEPYQLEADGFLARAICHEIDHLNGVLFVDHLRGLRRDRARRALRRLQKAERARHQRSRAFV